MIEAIEEPDGRFVLGVQWHAETLVADAEQLALFERLVEATRHPARPRRANASASAAPPRPRRQALIATNRRTSVPTQSRTAPNAEGVTGDAIGAIASPADAGALMPANTAHAPGAWSRWSPGAEASPWTVGIEEEVMLLDPDDWALASRADAVMSGLTGELAAHTSTETHGSALELRTDPHATVAGGLAQLAELRGDLARELEQLELRAAAAGLHPFTLWQDTQISDGERYHFLYGSMRELARREPTFALHVHVAVPDPESALRAINRMRAHLPLLLALSANSPFWQGRDTGLASARTPLFQAFPRVGIPRAFLDYADYVEHDRPAAALRGVPRAHVPVVGRAPAAALRHDRGADHGRADDRRRLGGADRARAVPRAPRGTEGSGADPLIDLPEVLAENRFLAARDGAEASLIDARLGRRSPCPRCSSRSSSAASPHAEDLGCEEELQWTRNLAATPRPKRQIDLAQGPDKLPGLVEALSALF